jgi:RimJ/RimL family protein N-acetyltransferase
MHINQDSHRSRPSCRDCSLGTTAEDREGVFAIRRRADGAVVGSSRFMAVRRPDRVIEIGWTWFNPSAWRTGVNLETKLLMLGYAFEGLGCVRVELKTDARNERSRKAIAALPAQFEGVFRKHMIVPDVGQRDSAYYSVIDDEWPRVRANLERRLGR